MSKGLSLHIGLNELSDHYDELWEPLQGCHHDAQDMEAFAKNGGFKTRLLLADEARYGTVVEEVRSAAFELSAGDYFLWTFAGHGSKVPDWNEDEENDSKDETWCLWDRMLVDDEIFGLLAEFDPGVRIAVVADCCYSGGSISARFRLQQGDSRIMRALSEEAGERTYRQRAEIYKAAQEEYPKGRNVEIDASVVFLAACQPEQLALDGPRNGAFTEVLKDVWQVGGFTGYKSFLDAIGRGRMPQGQDPFYEYLPRGSSNEEFEERVRPFTLGEKSEDIADQTRQERSGPGS